MSHFKCYDAVLCAECDEVFEMGPEHCPSCTCSTLIYLSTLLDPKAVKAEINLVRFMNAGTQ